MYLFKFLNVLIIFNYVRNFVNAVELFSKVIFQTFVASSKYMNFSLHVFSGRLCEKVTVTFDGQALATFKRDDAIMAHVLQMSAFWNYNADYLHDVNGKPLSKDIQMFFDFILIYIWDIRLRYKASTSTTVKKYPIPAELLSFEKKWKPA